VTIDPDISAKDALALLSVRDHPTDRLSFDRRKFLQMVGYGVGAGVVGGGLGEALAPALLPSRLREAWATGPIGATDGILVLIGQFGGADGLNTVVPYSNSTYVQQHGSLAIAGSQVLQINGSVGLHPSLRYTKSLYDAGEVAIVQGVGYPNPDLSHFSSMAYWMHGYSGAGMPSTGWIGRWLDGLGGDELFRAASVGSGLPLHLIGNSTRGTAIPEWGIGFGGGTDEHDLWMYDAMHALSATPAGRGAWHDTIASTVRGVLDVGEQVGPVFDRDLPEGDLENKLTVAARLINADLGLRVIDTGYDGFDTHAGQPDRLAALLTDFDSALKAFWTTLDDRFRSRVTIMTYSEFGRTSWSNDSQGTDHGTANNLFVIGRGVKGGLYGAQPSLAGLARWDRMPFNVDFRSVYASVLDGWMGGGSSTVLGGSYTNLGLFRTGPGQGVASGAVPPSVLGDYVGVTPYRLYDSRLAPRLLPLGAGTAGEVQVTGRGAVPAAGVTAVALNVTATGATQASAFTVWPTGDPRPVGANLITPAKRSVPNLAIVKVGQGGRVNVFNDTGETHAVIDVVGYFRTAAGNRLQTVTPFRALDTRYGTGGRSTPLGPNQSYDVTVRGIGGVPATADSVVVNVTVVAPTTPGFLTVWPALQTRPLASNLNFVAGQVVPNLVLAKVGTNSKISVYNPYGSTHVVMDVVGYLSPTAPGRYFPLTQSRLLDTRVDSGGPGPVKPASTTTLTVLGVGGVPASGVSAVALNIAAHDPTADTYITAWPNGPARPTTSSLNPLKGTNVVNQAIVMVGTGGKVQIYNAFGTLDLVVDAAGYFTA
jgi:uncharacterized protein (DUF1501 family)